MSEERPLNEYIDMEAYDVVSGERYRELVEQLESKRENKVTLMREVSRLREALLEVQRLTSGAVSEEGRRLHWLAFDALNSNPAKKLQ